MTDNPQIEIPALKRPTLKQLQEKWSWIKSIEKDASPIKATTLNLISVLKDGETHISGAEYEKRLPTNVLGFQHAQWLVDHQDELPEFMALLGKVYIDFTGLVVAGSLGDRYYPYLYRSGGRWYLRWGWIGRGFNSSERIAYSGKVEEADQSGDSDEAERSFRKESKRHSG